MNTYNINDQTFLNSDLYQDFIKDNPKIGRLRIRAFAANEAVPIEGVNITVSTIYNDNNIIFYKGVTDSSGLIERIFLPAPLLVTNNLEIPNKRVYEILATYPKDNLNTVYKVNIYEDVCVVQNINIVPSYNGGMF